MEIEIKKEHIEISMICEEGGFIIRCFENGQIDLYEVPLYGGDERFNCKCQTINEAIRVGRSWT